MNNKISLTGNSRWVLVFFRSTSSRAFKYLEKKRHKHYVTVKCQGIDRIGFQVPDKAKAKWKLRGLTRTSKHLHYPVGMMQRNYNQIRQASHLSISNSQLNDSGCLPSTKSAQNSPKLSSVEFSHNQHIYCTEIQCNNVSYLKTKQSASRASRRNQNQMPEIQCDNLTSAFGHNADRCKIEKGCVPQIKEMMDP